MVEYCKCSDYIFRVLGFSTTQESERPAGLGTSAKDMHHMLSLPMLAGGLGARTSRGEFSQHLVT